MGGEVVGDHPDMPARIGLGDTDQQVYPAVAVTRRGAEGDFLAVADTIQIMALPRWVEAIRQVFAQLPLPAQHEKVLGKLAPLHPLLN